MTDFAATKASFHMPDGLTYLDGNSLGPLPITATEIVKTVMADEWGQMLIGGWNKAGWMEMPDRIGDRIAKIIGAPTGSVTIGDTLSIKVHQALAAAIDMRPGRRKILSDNGNFPSDLYIASGLLHALDKAHTLTVVDPEHVESALDEDVAVLLLTQVDYRTGRMHDMVQLTKKAHEVGAVVVWDLAHSAGALPIEVIASGAEFAVGCTYKYLNGGPGAPGFIYVHPDLADQVRPALSGWLGHEAPFAFDLDYRPAPGVSRMRVGTPPVLQMAALNAALEIWDSVDIKDVRAQSIMLSERFIAGVEAKCPQLELASPRDPETRGSQVSFRFVEGYALMQALIARDVVGDFRAPNIVRFGFAPLYNDVADVDRAVEVMASILDAQEWDQPKFKQRAKVT